MTGAQSAKHSQPTLKMRAPYLSRLSVILSDVTRMLGVAGCSVGLKIASIIMTFVTTVLIARTLSAGGVGVYALAAVSATLGAVITAAGFETLMMRYGARVSKIRTQRRIWRVLAVFVLISPISIVVSSIMVALLMIAYGFSLEMTLAPVALQASAMGAYRVLTAAVQAHGRVVASQAGQFFIRPAIVLMLIYYFHLNDSLSAQSVLWAMAAGAGVSLIYISSILILLEYGGRAPRLQHYPKDVIAGLTVRGPAYAGYFVVVLLLEQVDILLLGVLLGAEAAGLYQPASRVAWVAALGVIAISIIVRPQIAKAVAERDFARINRQIQTSRIAAVVYFIGASLILMAFSEQIFTLFGEDYAGASQIMLILLASHGVASMIGPVDSAAQLLGSGQRILTRALFSLCVFVIIGLLMIPVYGAIGAAIAAFVGSLLYRLSLLGFVRRKLHEMKTKRV